MSEIAKSIGILTGLVILSNFLTVVPDFSAGESIVFSEAGGNLFFILFGLAPIIILILLDLDIINVYSLPFSDILDGGVRYLTYISVLVSGFVFPYYSSALSNAISFVMALFVILFPLYLFYDDIIRFKLQVENRFIRNYLPSAVFFGLIVFSIVYAYGFGQQELYLPGDLLFSLGTYTILDIAVPNLVILSLCGIVLFIIYEITLSPLIYMFLKTNKYNRRGGKGSQRRR